jgi:hypothetical protein
MPPSAPVSAAPEFQGRNACALVAIAENVDISTRAYAIRPYKKMVFWDFPRP